jgi:hypothetical protein
MKGLITLFFCLFALSANASLGIKARDLSAIKLFNGEIIENLNLQESTKVLESLDRELDIEIRSQIIYPEEVSQLILSKLTKAGFLEKNPNQQDYN